MTGFYEAYLKKRQEHDLMRTGWKMHRFSLPFVVMDGNKLINFASNDYLGLAQDERVQKGAQKWLMRYGAGLGASRLMGASLEEVIAFEERMAHAKNMSRAFIMASGFACNMSVLATMLDSAVLGGQAITYGDKCNHASLYAGVRLAGAELKRYHHLDMTHLEDLLKKDIHHPHKFIVSETLFSMDGDCADIDNLAFLAKKYGALLFLDDAHAFGIMGEDGYGLAHGENMPENCVITATFGKALGGYGAVCFCTEEIYHLCLQHAGGLVYSTALAPSVMGAMEAAFNLLPSLTQERATLKENAHILRGLLKQESRPDSPIVPVVIGEAARTLSVAQSLQTKGFFVPAIRPPTVAPTTSRLRLSVSARHSKAHIKAVAHAIHGEM